MPNYKRAHTIAYIIHMTSWWIIYILNWELRIIPCWIAFIIIGSCTVLQTMCWRVYLYWDDQWKFTAEEIIKCLPIDVLMKIVEERNDVRIRPASESEQLERLLHEEFRTQEYYEHRKDGE